MPRRTALSLLLLAACAHPHLVPIGRQGPAGAAMARGGGVVLLAASGWRHSDEVASATTPVFVTVMNQGAGAIDLRYGDLSLVDDAGRAHAVVPPNDLLETLYGAPTAGGGDGFFDLGGRSLFGDIGEPGGRALPESELSPAEGEHYWPRDYRRVLDHALREGPIAPGGRREGYVFFQPAWESRRVTLHLRVQRGAGPALDLSVAFDVER